VNLDQWYTWDWEPFHIILIHSIFLGLTLLPFQSILVWYAVGEGLYSRINFLLGLVYTNLESLPKPFLICFSRGDSFYRTENDRYYWLRGEYVPGAGFIFYLLRRILFHLACLAFSVFQSTLLLLSLLT